MVSYLIKQVSQDTGHLVLYVHCKSLSTLLQTWGYSLKGLGDKINNVNLCFEATHTHTHTPPPRPHTTHKWLGKDLLKILSLASKLAVTKQKVLGFHLPHKAEPWLQGPGLSGPSSDSGLRISWLPCHLAGLGCSPPRGQAVVGGKTEPAGTAAEPTAHLGLSPLLSPHPEFIAKEPEGLGVSGKPQSKHTSVPPDTQVSL